MLTGEEERGQEEVLQWGGLLGHKVGLVICVEGFLVGLLLFCVSFVAHVVMWWIACGEEELGRVAAGGGAEHKKVSTDPSHCNRHISRTGASSSRPRGSYPRRRWSQP